MNITQLNNKINKDNLRGIYLLYGDNAYEIERALKKIKKGFGELIKGINYINIDANSIGTLLSNIETPAFGYESKFIFARNTMLFKKEAKTKKTQLSSIQDNIKDYLEENIDYINKNVLIVFYEDIVEKNNLFQEIEKIGIVCNFENYKIGELSTKIKQICSLYRVNIDSKTINKFISLVGTDMQDVINEIRKLIEFSGEGGTITRRRY